MILMLGGCVKWTSDRDNTELLQDTFILGIIRQTTT